MPRRPKKYRPRSKRKLLNLRLWDPFMRPEWRHLRVLQMLDRADRKARVGRYDDEYIREAKNFIARWRSGGALQRRQLLYDNPGLYFAYKLFERKADEPELSFMIEARLLAGQSDEEIADAVKTIPETIKWYDAVFFNVRPFLRHHDWIVNHVLIPASERFAPESQDHDHVDSPELKAIGVPLVVRPHLDMTLKFFSYFGGPLLCEFMISGFKRGMIVRSQEEIGDWLDEQFSHTMRMRSAQAATVFDVNRYTVELLFNTHTQLMALARNEDSTDERRNTFERHIQGMLSEIPWVAGKAGDEVYAGTKLGKLDNHAAELRDEELQIIAAGEDLADLEKELPDLVIPALFHDDKEGPHADAKPKG